MVKYLVLLFLLLFIPDVEAKRGCCSHHHGVSHCDQSSGRIVCNDGSYSPSCTCEYAPPTPVAKKHVSKHSVKRVVRNYNCQTMIITEKSAKYYKDSNGKIPVGNLNSKTKVVKTGNFKNNMFEIKLSNNKERFWIKKESCNCL